MKHFYEHFQKASHYPITYYDEHIPNDLLSLTEPLYQNRVITYYERIWKQFCYPKHKILKHLL